MNIKRAVTLRLLNLIRELSNKATDLEGVGVKLVAADELIEGVANTIFDLHGIKPTTAGSLHLSLADYISGDIEEHDFMGLLSTAGSAVTL